MPAADSDPDECFSEARYHRLHNTAVSFVSSDIRVFNCVSPGEDIPRLYTRRCEVLVQQIAHPPRQGGTPEVAPPSPPITTRVTRALPSDDDT